MFYGKTLKRDLEELRKEVEHKDREIEGLKDRFNLLDRKVDRLEDRNAELSRIVHNHVDGEITYMNISKSPFQSIFGLDYEYVYIYKDKREYKFNGINLDNPVITKLSENLLKVYDKEVPYIFDLSNEKVIKY